MSEEQSGKQQRTEQETIERQTAELEVYAKILNVLNPQIRHVRHDLAPILQAMKDSKKDGSNG